MRSTSDIKEVKSDNKAGFAAVEKRFDALGGKVNVLLAFALVGGGVGATAAYLKKQNK